MQQNIKKFSCERRAWVLKCGLFRVLSSPADYLPSYPLLLNFLPSSRGACVCLGPLSCRPSPRAWPSTWLSPVSQKQCCHLPLAQDSGFPWNNFQGCFLADLLGARSMWAQPAVTLVLQVVECPETSAWPLGLSSDPPFPSLSLSPWGSADASWPDAALGPAPGLCHLHAQG